MGNRDQRRHMLCSVIRAVATLLFLIVIGISVATLTGGAFWIGGGVANCAGTASSGSGPIPAILQGGYEVALHVQAGDFVMQPAATIEVKPDTVAVTAETCPDSIRTTESR